jgi:hypothetical protein
VRQSQICPFERGHPTTYQDLQGKSTGRQERSIAGQLWPEGSGFSEQDMKLKTRQLLHWLPKPYETKHWHVMQKQGSEICKYFYGQELN